MDGKGRAMDNIIGRGEGLPAGLLDGPGEGEAV
jgi:hypothetical protein